MFGLKKQARQVMEAVLPSPTVTAEMIQREIVERQDQVLAEAKAILAQPTKDRSKAQRLIEL